MSIVIRDATVLDVDRIVELINKHAEKGLMLPKTPYKIFSTIQNFFVAVENEDVIGCVALSVIWKDLAEICSLAVDDGYKGKGVGKKLVAKCIEKAKKLKLPKIIALTYQNQFFEKLNFKLVDKNMFPRKLWRECLECPKLESCDESAYIYYIS